MLQEGKSQHADDRESPDLAPAGKQPDQGRVFFVPDEVAIEDFAEGSLVLLCEQLRLVQLNPTARDIVGRLDGQRTLYQVAEQVAQKAGHPVEQVLGDIQDLVADLEVQGVVRRCAQKSGVAMSEVKRYLANPDVSCRVEGPDGALLFNPDTDGTMILNPTGLLIWEALTQARTQEELVAHLLERCDDVPADRVAGDVDEFLQSLLPSGFVGEVLE